MRLSNRDAEVARTLLALLLPVVALWVQLAYWPFIKPFAWFLFYPAVFLSALVGSRWAAATATLVSVCLVWWFFVPPAHQWAKDEPRALLAAVVFVGMGLAFSYFGGRLRVAWSLAESLVEQAPDGVFVADLDGRYTDVNEAGCRLLGYRRGEIIGKTIRDLIPPEDAGKLAVSRSRLLQGQLDIDEWRLRRADGSYVAVEVSAKILADGRWQGFVRDISVRKEMERALRDREADLNRAQAVAQIGSWRLDVRLNRLLWSAENYRIFGLPEGMALTYETFLSRVHPADRAEVDRCWQAALKGGAYDIEHRLLIDDQVKWVREKADLEFTEGGELVGGIGITQDITIRKRAESDLLRAHETERALRAELEDLTSAGDAISEAVAKLPKTNITAVMQMIAMQAQSLAEAEFAALGVGTDPERPFDPWVLVGLPQAAAEKIEGRHYPRGLLGRVACKGETVKVADVSTLPDFLDFSAAPRRITSFMGVPIAYGGRSLGNLFLANKMGAREFSAQDERRVRLLASRAAVAIETATLYADEALQRVRLQSIIDQMPEVVVSIDLAGKVVLQNQRAQILRSETDRVLGDGTPVPFDVRHADGSAVAADELPLVKAVRQGVSTVGAELLIVGPDGETVPVLVSASALRIEGEIVGGVGVFQDISDIKALERMREEWAAIIAHDLRQPVGVIGVTAELLPSLHAGAISDKERKAVDRIRAASQAMNRMISDLLDSSRLEARRLAVDAGRCELRSLVAGVIEQMKAVAGHDRPIEFHSPASVPVYCDAGRVEQVIANLFSNAIKYGDPGTPITVAIAGGDLIEVAVTNRGAGIAREDMPTIFSRFARTHQARAGKAPGLGLGLYIAHGLIEAQGGTMWAESIPGATTTFRFTLPRAPKQRGHLEPAAPSPTGAGGADLERRARGP